MICCKNAAFRFSNLKWHGTQKNGLALQKGHDTTFFKLDGTMANTHLSDFFTFDLDLWVMVTQNVANYSPHHVTHGPGKFEVATSNG